MYEIDALKLCLYAYIFEIRERLGPEMILPLSFRVWLEPTGELTLEILFPY
jgi:hypothetical protein